MTDKELEEKKEAPGEVAKTVFEWHTGAGGLLGRSWKI